MENKVEVKVNVINQLKLLRQSTFKDQLSFLDEDIQNAQRAKSSTVSVKIDYYGKKLIIENDGKVLENPQALFSIAESEWDEEVTRTESPFGMGFFSNITVSDYIEVFSGNKHIIFNVGEMIQSNKTDIQVDEVEEFYDGFKLILNNFDYNQVGTSQIRERVEVLGKYIHILDIYCDGKLQPKMDLCEGDGSTFLLKLEDEQDVQGWIALNTDFSQDLKVFYKGRFVTKINDFYYIKGDLHITDKTLNLTAPDRKDILKDSKLAEFKKSIRMYIEELCLDSFLNGYQEDVDDYIEPITRYINKKELKNFIKFLVFKGEKDEDIKYLQGIALLKKKNKDLKSFNDFEVFMNSEAAKESSDVSFIQETKTKPDEAKGVRVIHDDYEQGSYREGRVEKPEIKEKHTVERQAEEIIIENEPVFWISFDEVVEHEKKFNIAKHYGLNIVVARNKLEGSILDMMGQEQDILHISKLTEESKVRAYITNTKLGIREQRALMLLDMISRVVGLDENVFAIGDLMVTKETRIEAINKSYESIEERAVAIYSKDNDKIYIDRSTIDQSKLRNDLTEELSLDDFKFILMHLKDIVKELKLIDHKSTEFKDSDSLYNGILTTLAIA